MNTLPGRDKKIHDVEWSEDYNHKQHGVYSTVPMEISKT